MTTSKLRAVAPRSTDVRWRRVVQRTHKFHMNRCRLLLCRMSSRGVTRMGSIVALEVASGTFSNVSRVKSGTYFCVRPNKKDRGCLR